MKTIHVIITMLIFSSILTSCGKYEEGPGFTIRTKTHRVAGTWKIQNLYFNGTEINSLVPSDYTETYDKDGNYSYSSSGGSGSGRWEFQNDKAEIKRSGVSGQSTETLVILRLKEKEFWYYFMDGSDKYEYRMVAQ
ncbi:MAG: hypothetical protein ACOZCO_07755 [Bacteroidota bacterium]